MSEENENTEKVRRDLVALTDLSSQKVNIWLEQIRTKKRGVKISKKDLLNWLIEKTPDILSNSDLNAIVEKFYDEEALLRQLLRDVKKAKIEGSSPLALDLVLRAKKADSKKDLGPPPSDETNEI
jgi:hypothetical protein